MVYKCCTFQFVPSHDPVTVGGHGPEDRGNSSSNVVSLGPFPDYLKVNGKSILMVLVTAVGITW